MSGERRIKTLKTRQKSILMSFGLIKTFVDDFNEETDACEVSVRLEHLVNLWNDFNGNQAELETLDEVAIDDHLKSRVDFETSYFKVKGFLLSMNKETPVSPRTSSSSTFTAHSPVQSSHVRLPDIKLPNFAGNLDQWLNFHDLFVSLVHSSHELSNIQKFYYLRSSLSGEALKLVQTIAISANNYQVAWNLLLDHYQNPLRLKQSYVDALFEFPSIKRESSTELHSLVEKFEANVKVLAQLGEKTQFWDVLLIRMLSIRLDPTTRRDWEEHSSTLNVITFKELTTFIQRRVTVLQTIGKTIDTSSSVPNKKLGQRVIASHGASQMSQRKCIFCSDHHPLYQCIVFSKMSVDEKEKEVRRHQLCRNCLRKGHQAKECPSSSTCRKCRGHHHTQLCFNPAQVNSKVIEPPQPKESGSHQPTDQPSASVSATLADHASYASAGRGRKGVLLATAVVIVVDDNGVEHTARALLDSGSECCFATESFSQLIKVQRKRIHLPIAGIGQSSTESRFKFASTIRSRVSEFSANVELLVLPKVAIDLPSTTINTSSWNIPSGVQLADPAFYEPSKVDLILGAEIFFDLFKVSGRISLGPGLPVLVNSVFGWVVSGRSAHHPTTAPIVANVASIVDLHELLQKFWTIEEDGVQSCYSVEEAACEEHFRRTVTRTPQGRYVVSLPIKEEILANLGDNRRTAIRRFHFLEGKLTKNEELYQQYRDFMEEYLKLGHMQLVRDSQHTHLPRYHLPHHAVIKEDSTTTKVRVVFDASCPTIKGPSLNNALMVGPIVQEDLRSITMRSRIYPVLLNADIKQMYRQILTDEKSNSLQHIVWRSSPEAPLQTYELKTVTYGTASAPFLATRVLKQLADDEHSEFPKAATVLRKDFYIDDLFSGAATVEEAIDLRIQLESLLKKGGFELRKWASNEPAVIQDVPLENRALKDTIDFDKEQCIKTLGLHWEPGTDVLRYKIFLPSTFPTDEGLTKRMALSHIARLFDPLGLVGPVITTAKIFMQGIWCLIDEDGKPWSWDKELPASFKTRWNNYQSQLPNLNELRVARCVIFPSPTTLQIHIFTDASENAYGACVYIRSTSTAGDVKVALLASKSKVSPLKKQSIPRLELCGALIGAQLYEKVVASLQLNADTFFWVDSTVVLCWLKSPPSAWTTFVANRVSKIQLATVNCSWNHIAGVQNPADLISRGTTANDIVASKLWWNGPDWLAQKMTEWPTAQLNSSQSMEALQEAKRTQTVAVTATEELSFIDEYILKYSNYYRMLRVTAYCLRFVRKCHRKFSEQPSTEPPTCYLTTDEIKSAELALIAMVQRQCFSNEWEQLQQRKPISPKSRLRWFHPFIDEHRVLRLGGRLSKSQLPYDSKHQILLPSSHPISALLLRSLHLRQLHAAPQLLLAILRTRYWVIGARDIAKRITRNCVVCFRNRPKSIQQFMAELPTARVSAARPFTTTGVDYWGPIQVKSQHRRAAPTKAYVAVFVCFSTKAVHLELVADLTTAKFIQALRRFVSRRGLCSDIHSDNGRNFVGAANELRKLVTSTEHKAAIAEECNVHGIRWHFNPPAASHFGGLWEAAISSAQKHFHRVLGPHILPFDETETLLTQIECCLNSRPIIPISDDPSDLQVLTPGHFLTGSALKGVPDNDYTDIPLNRLHKWQQTQKIFQHLWQRWHLEYLATLQPRTKWLQPSTGIEKGQLVIIKDENTPPMCWRTARIIGLHPGTDGIVRVVTLRTSQGTCMRPVSKLCLLPFAASSPSKTIPSEDASIQSSTNQEETKSPEPAATTSNDANRSLQ